MIKKLLPAIIQDAGTKKVLMLGYMNEDALNKTISGPNVWFYSRSRNKLLGKAISNEFLFIKPS